MEQTEFEKFVDEMRDKINRDKNVRIAYNGLAGLTIAYHIPTGKCGAARCRRGDSYNLYVGNAIAYARLREYPIPQQRANEFLEDLEDGECFYFEESESETRKLKRIAKNPYLDNMIICADVDTGELININKGRKVN